ncbi:MAG: hypothetical protein MAG453_02184 [Calditrichaeota bacterium]|nr:hypothetical protein [Calditrichota bacterium]
MGLLGAILVNTFGDKKAIRKIGRKYYIDILKISEEGEKATNSYWEKYDDIQLKVLAIRKKKKLRL